MAPCSARTLVIEADWVLPVSGPPIRGGAVRVEGGVIREVGPAPLWGEKVLSFPGCVLLPGLVNAHTHLEYSAFGGFSAPVSFPRWLLRLLLARRKLTAADWAASALWGAYECARNGITSIADTSYEGGAVARAARAVGLRARVYLEVFGLDDAELPQTVAGLEARLARLRAEFTASGPAARTQAASPQAALSQKGPYLEWGLSPHAPYTVSARLYRETARLARWNDLRLATHVAESPAEVEMLRHGRGPIARVYQAARLWKGERWHPPGTSPVRYVAETGALAPRTLVIHAVQVDEVDAALLATSGAAVAHCPRSNLWLQCGTAPVRLLREAGVVVGLGTDGLCSNEDLDMFAEMRAAAAAHGLTATEVLRMATLDGARALGWNDQVGSIEPGKRADLVVVRRKGRRAGDPAREPAPGLASGVPGPTTGDPTEELLAEASASDVVMTMVDGVVVFSGGERPPEVVAGLNRARERLGLPSLED